MNANLITFFQGLAQVRRESTHRNVLWGLGLLLAVAGPTPAATNSSPIAISLNDRLIWAVNPDDDSVSVIRPDNNTRLAKIAVGNELYVG